jgi:VanZ family protein
LKYYIPAIICAISIFWLSVTSGANLPETFKDLMSIDKVAHAIAYGVLAGLLFSAGFLSKGQLSSRHIIFVSFGASFYGFLMELIQYSFFPGRYFEVLDILANIMGIVIINLIFKLFLNKTTTA